jgi:signal transduction histidine kinase
MSEERRHTLLLVDDEIDALEPMSMLLEDDYRVLTAGSGAQALERLEREKVDIVIADQRMPGMTGVELLARVRELYPDVVRLILTAYTDFEAMLEAINAGRVYRYIIKPWDPDDMRVTIRQALQFRDLVLTKGRLDAEIAEAHSDLAERTRKLEEAQETIIQQEKLAAVGRFAAEMTHEINNHLQVILGVNMERDIYGPEEQRRIIEQQARMLHLITQDIRDFSLGASLPFVPQEVDPVQICEEVVRTCEHHPTFRDNTVIFEHVGTGRFMLDARQFKHLLFNLLKNAAHASPPGRSVQINLEMDEEMKVMVVDRGAGIADEHKERIFEPFFTTSGSKGTGLGLSICQRVVQMHDGAMEVEDTPGGGATFVVTLPRRGLH